MKGIKRVVSIVLSVLIITTLFSSISFVADAVTVDASKYLFGDVNGNKEIDITDLTIVIENVNGTREFSEEEKIIADVNGNGIVDQNDVDAIQTNIVNGLEFTVYSLLRDYGYCGENAKYLLKNDGTLIIFGTGNMNAFSYSNTPWNSQKDSIKSIEIKKDISNIGVYSFYACQNLLSVTIANSVKSIGDNAFNNCQKLSSITIPDSVTSIGNGAFVQCMSLNSVTIPKSVTSIYFNAFSSCYNLTSINVDSGNPNYSSINGNLYNKGATEIIKYASGKPNTSFIIPDSVIKISGDAFCECKNLISITTPNSVTSIIDGAFYYCDNLKSIVIPNKITKIENYTFGYCKSLESVTIPKSVTSIGDGSFYSCVNLKDVYYSGSQSEWNCITIGKNNTYLNNATIHYLENDKTIHRYNIKDIVNNDSTKQVKTKTYYFYMPEAWRNEYNDYYDGNNLSSCVPGIYWWEGSYNCNDYQEEQENGWPGYAVTETVDGKSNYFKAEVPEDVTTIIWNNLVDGGEDKTLPVYSAVIQTQNIGSEYYDPNEDGYGFYPQGVDDFDNMIYICNPSQTTENTYNKRLTYNGAWFYYYGSGEYGVYKTREEANSKNAVYSNGEWPGNPKTIVPIEATTAAPTEPTTVSPTETPTLEPTKKANTLTIAISQQPITISAEEIKNDYLLENAFVVLDAKGTVSYSKIDGDENITVDSVSGAIQIKKTIKSGIYPVKIKIFASGNESYKAASDNVTISIKIDGNSAKSVQTISAKSITKTNGNKPFNLKAKISGNGKLSYKSSNKKVATVSSKGKVTIKGCGKATITIKAAETSTYKSAAKNITLTVKPKKLKIKSGSGNKKAYTIKFKSQKTVSGYECTYKNGGKNHKITVNSKKSSVTLKKLVKGNCVVKIRAYKKVVKTKVYGAYGKIRLSIS